MNLVTFKLKGNVTQTIVLESGEEKDVRVTTYFTIVVNLEEGEDHGKAWYQGVNKTPFNLPQEILEILKEEA